jgi:outer membrane protein assembly factor BamE (lipoprotein component of BamABCDE complex)
MRAIIFFMLIIFTGCATVGTEIKQANIDKLQKGKTTKEEVTKVFGQPDVTYFDKDGNLIYAYTASKVKNTAWNFIPVVNIVHSEMAMKNQMLSLTFSKDGILQDYSFVNSDKAMKYGIIP